MGKWVLVAFSSVIFLASSQDAYAQYYKKINKDGSLSFSDNATSSLLKNEDDRTSDKLRERVKGTTPAALAQKGIEEPTGEVLKLFLPDKSWALELPFKGFQIEQTSSLPDLKGRKIMANNRESSVVLSAFLSPATQSFTSTELRETAWKQLKLPYKKEAIKKYETGEWAYLDYILKEAPNYKGFDQKNVFAFLVKGDTWIDFHLSKVKYYPEEEHLFKDFIAGVKVLDNFIPSSFDNFSFGSYFYLKKDFERSIIYYKRALDQENQTPRLQKTFWRVLVDNLGMAYGLSGDLEMSKKTFQYGISKDHGYPMFYYNLACTFAELNDLGKAILNLGTAAKYKSNMIVGENWPDPIKDSSFQRFLNDQKFIQAAQKFSK